MMPCPSRTPCSVTPSAAARRRRFVVAPSFSSALAAILLLPFAIFAQRGAPPAPAGPPRAVAPIDVTGYWVSVITEDWRWRMVTPHKGDYTSVPLSPEGKRV